MMDIQASKLECLKGWAALWRKVLNVRWLRPGAEPKCTLQFVCTSILCLEERAHNKSDSPTPALTGGDKDYSSINKRGCNIMDFSGIIWIHEKVDLKKIDVKWDSTIRYKVRQQPFRIWRGPIGKMGKIFSAGPVAIGPGVMALHWGRVGLD